MKRSSIILLFILTGIRQSFAGTASSPAWSPLTGSSPSDSLLPVKIAPTIFLEEKALEAELGDIELGYHATGDHRRTLNRLLKMAAPGASRWSRSIRYRLFDDLARVSARLRLYPLAMTCYSNAGGDTNSLPADSIYYQENVVAESTPTAIDSIRAAFDDGKDAVAYALLVGIKQPAPGKRKAFTHFSNVGHTFITLIKYNRDHSVVCRSFGFYPHKTRPLDATPIHPSSPSVIKDDSRHEWDELAGKFISARRFKKMLEVLQSYDHRIYNLNHGNCTDFGLTMAGLGGIRIGTTIGHWPLGKGNNPGSAGQSMLEGKLVNLDPENAVPLFTATDHVPKSY